MAFQPPKSSIRTNRRLLEDIIEEICDTIVVRNCEYDLHAGEACAVMGENLGKLDKNLRGWGGNSTFAALNLPQTWRSKVEVDGYEQLFSGVFSAKIPVVQEGMDQQAVDVNVEQACRLANWMNRNGVWQCMGL